MEWRVEPSSSWSLSMTVRHLIVFVLLFAAPASAQTPPDLTQVALQDLMRIEVLRVFGASERLQPVTEAPSSVTIVTAREIAQYGYRTVADILRSARAFYISDDRNYSYVGVRGFSRPGDYSTRILMLVNGHRVNDAVYDQAPIGADFGIDVAMIERVEIIRGPASSLYGTSAFFAVVNIITRTGASLNGVAVDLAAGTLGTGMARVSAGRRLRNGVDVAVSGTIERSDGDTRLYFPAFDSATTNGGVAADLDGERVANLYGRLAAGNFALTATFGRRLKVVPTASFGSIFNEQDEAEQTTDRRTMIAGQYNRTLGQTQLVLDAGFDWYAYRGRYPFESDTPDYPVLVNSDAAEGVRWNGGGHLVRKVGARHVVTAGGEYSANIRQNQWSNYNDPGVVGIEELRSSQQAGLYLQDEIRVRRWLLLNVGARYDQYEDFRRATPRGAVIVTPSPSTSFKYLYGEAFRAPNAYELYYYGSGSLRPEFVRTNEVVWEQYVGEWLRTSVSAYRYNASQLITFQALSSDGGIHQFAFVNDGEIKASGLELEAELRTKRGIQVLTSYVLQDARPSGADAPLTNSPRHMAKARVEVPLTARAFATGEWQFIGVRSTLAGAHVGAAAPVHLTVGWTISKSLALTGSLRNLFNQAYSDPGSDEHLPDSIPQTQRTARIGLRWLIGTP
jgi:outer membrane receptor for ferrienterochelin and colicins